MTPGARPTGITIICLLLGWLSFAGFGNAVVITSGLMGPIPRWFGVVALAYGITAFVSMLKLWRMRRDGIVWFRSWTVVVFLASLATIPIFSNLAVAGIGQILALVASTVVILVLLERYVAKQLSAVE